MKKTSSIESPGAGPFGWSDFVAQVKNSLFGSGENPSASKASGPKHNRESIVQEIDSSDDEGINQQLIHRTIRPSAPGSPFKDTEEKARVKVSNYPTF